MGRSRIESQKGDRSKAKRCPCFISIWRVPKGKGKKGVSIKILSIC